MIQPINSSTTIAVYAFKHIWDLAHVLYVISGVSGLTAILFWWLALQEYYRAIYDVRHARHPGRGFEFDIYRGFSFAGLIWCCLSIVMAIEPHMWMASVERQYSVFGGWLVIALGWMLGLLMFAACRVLELLGLHKFQQLNTHELTQPSLVM